MKTKKLPSPAQELITTQTTRSSPRFRTAAELLQSLGGIPSGRVRLQPHPGEATELDLLEPDAKLCELIDGILVEKTMGAVESMLTIELAMILAMFVKRYRLGTDGMVRLMPGKVRLPDISFISWDRLPGRKAPTTPILDLAPDLAVEVISKGNTRAEIERKLGEYFEAGVRLVWLIHPKPRTALVHTSPRGPTKLKAGQSLEGGEILPGFSLPLIELFECLDRGLDG